LACRDVGTRELDLEKADEDRIGTFEMKELQQGLRVLRTDKRTGTGQEVML